MRVIVTPDPTTRFIPIGAGVNGGVGTSSSAPETSGILLTKSFKKSNRFSDKIHCFLINIKNQVNLMIQYIDTR